MVMERIPTMIPVVAALIQDPVGRLLLQQVPPGKRHAGLWEFPGGKVEAGETPRYALVREVSEELGLHLDGLAMVPAGFAGEALSDAARWIVLFLYACPVWSGQPDGCEGQEWGWFTPEQACDLALATMDRALLTDWLATFREPIAKPVSPAYVPPLKRARSSAG